MLAQQVTSAQEEIKAEESKLVQKQLTAFGSSKSQVESDAMEMSAAMRERARTLAAEWAEKKAAISSNVLQLEGV